MTYKTTPALFLPVLLWKRQWRALATAVVLIVCFNLLPALYLGWDLTARCYRQSWEYLQASARLEDIADNGIEYPNPRNQSLMSLFARYLQTYPPAHPLYVDHPAFVQFGDLDHATARAVAKGCMLLLGGFIAFRLWGRWSPHAPELPGQWSAVCVFAALVSPMCWRQHLVLALPALYLLVWSLLARRNPKSEIRSPKQIRNPNPKMNLSRLSWDSDFGFVSDFGLRISDFAAWCALGISVLLLWTPQSEIIGNVQASVLMAYKPDTLIFSAWALALLHARHRQVMSQSLPIVPSPEMQRTGAA